MTCLIDEIEFLALEKYHIGQHDILEYLEKKVSIQILKLLPLPEEKNNKWIAYLCKQFGLDSSEPWSSYADYFLCSQFYVAPVESFSFLKVQINIICW